MDAALALRMPRSVRRTWSTASRGFLLPLVIWSVEGLGVPVYPEERVFPAIGRTLCAGFTDSEAVRLELVRTRRFAPKESTLLGRRDLSGWAFRPAG